MSNGFSTSSSISASNPINTPTQQSEINKPAEKSESTIVIHQDTGMVDNSPLDIQNPEVSVEFANEGNNENNLEKNQKKNPLDITIQDTNVNYWKNLERLGINQKQPFNKFGRSEDEYYLGAMFADPNSSAKLQLAFTKSIQRNVSDSNDFKNCTAWINNNPLPNDCFKQMPGGTILQIKNALGEYIIPEKVYSA